MSDPRDATARRFFRVLYWAHGTAVALVIVLGVIWIATSEPLPNR